jgi:hypothetical protein
MGGNGGFTLAFCSGSISISEGNRKMCKQLIFLVVSGFFLLICQVVKAGENEIHLTGNPRVDLFSHGTDLSGWIAGDTTVSGNLTDETESISPRRSPWLAGSFSLAVPGAGEFYSESYVKSGIFFAVEVAAWIVAHTYDKKGDRQTNIFQDYADGRWSVVRYVEWVERYRGQLNPNAQYEDPISSNDTGLPPWLRVDWIKLNQMEREIGRRTGNGFTHSLPPRPEQQYYELIGKYHQYAGGWDDAWSGNTPLITADDIVAGTVSPRFLEYSRMRGKANDYYNTASTVVGIVVVNHVLSALDAFFTATRFNKSIHAEARLDMHETPYGPVAGAVGTVRVDL